MESQITREAAWELLRKYKSKGFAAGCSREVIEKGAEMLGWPLDEVLQKTLDGVPVDEKIGLKWIHKATFQGYQPAIDYCKEHGYKWY